MFSMSYSSLELDHENGDNGASGSGAMIGTPVVQRRRSSTIVHSDSDASTTAQEQLKDYVYKKVSAKSIIFRCNPSGHFFN